MENKTYEEAYKELEAIVAKLQEDNIDIDESIALFKKGIELQKYCEEILSKAEQNVTKILNENNQVEDFNNESF